MNDDLRQKLIEAVREAIRTTATSPESRVVKFDVIAERALDATLSTLAAEGPTEAMLEAGWNAVEDAEEGLPNGLSGHGMLRAAFPAMLSAVRGDNNNGE